MMHINKTLLKHSSGKSVCYCRKPLTALLSHQKKRQTRCLLCIQRLKEKAGLLPCFPSYFIYYKAEWGKKPKAEVNVLPQFSPPSQHLCYLIKKAVRWTDEFSWLSLFYRLQGATSVSPDPFSPLIRKLNTNYSIKVTWRINLIKNKEVLVCPLEG